MLVTLSPSSKIICTYCLTITAININRLELVLEVSAFKTLDVGLQTLNGLFMVTCYA